MKPVKHPGAKVLTNKTIKGTVLGGHEVSLRKGVVLEFLEEEGFFSGKYLTREGLIITIENKKIDHLYDDRAYHPWRIRSTKEKEEDGSPLFWSNCLGWVDLLSATEYLDEEKNSIQFLPLDSEWVAI